MGEAGAHAGNGTADDVVYVEAGDPAYNPVSLAPEASVAGEERTSVGGGTDSGVGGVGGIDVGSDGVDGGDGGDGVDVGTQESIAGAATGETAEAIAAAAGDENGDEEETEDDYDPDNDDTHNDDGSGGGVGVLSARDPSGSSSGLASTKRYHKRSEKIDIEDPSTWTKGQLRSALSACGTPNVCRIRAIGRDGQQELARIVFQFWESPNKKLLSQQAAMSVAREGIDSGPTRDHATTSCVGATGRSSDGGGVSGGVLSGFGGSEIRPFFFCEGTNKSMAITPL